MIARHRASDSRGDELGASDVSRAEGAGGDGTPVAPASVNTRRTSMRDQAVPDGQATPIVTCHVTFRGLPQSTALDRLIHERTDWLQQFAPDLTGVRALVDIPHRHRHEHAVRVQLRLSGSKLEPLSVEREGVGDAYALVRDTFDVARRCLQDVVREQRGCVKVHADGAGEMR